MEEVWKVIEGTDRFYEISNKGNIRKYLNPCVDAYGYPITTLKINGITKQRKIHQLVWDYFGDGDRGGMDVDHIDNNRANNDISNLQTLTHRENTTKGSKRKEQQKSRWVGVRWSGYKWEAHARIKGNLKRRIGAFNCETAAYFAYLKTLADNNIQNRMA